MLKKGIFFCLVLLTFNTFADDYVTMENNAKKVDIVRVTKGILSGVALLESVPKALASLWMSYHSKGFTIKHGMHSSYNFTEKGPHHIVALTKSTHNDVKKVKKGWNVLGCFGVLSKTTDRIHHCEINGPCSLKIHKKGLITVVQDKRARNCTCFDDSNGISLKDVANEVSEHLNEKLFGDKTIGSNTGKAVSLLLDRTKSSYELGKDIELISQAMPDVKIEINLK